MSRNKSKDAIMKNFQDAEEHSNKLFALMDELANEMGHDVDMSEVLA